MGRLPNNEGLPVNDKRGHCFTKRAMTAATSQHKFRIPQLFWSLEHLRIRHCLRREASSGGFRAWNFGILAVASQRARCEIRDTLHAAACRKSPPPLADDKKNHHGGDQHNQKNFTLTKQYSQHSDSIYDIMPHPFILYTPTLIQSNVYAHPQSHLLS
jgi:hypothetical protein